MISNLKEEILKASKVPGTVIGFNIFGFEDAKAVIEAGEELEYPVALMLNKLATKHLPIESWAGLLLPLVKNAKIPVSLHLDHCQDFQTIVKAIHSGFSSVMFDGSQYPLEKNIKLTKEIVKIAKCFNVSVEGEIGSVPYADIPGAAKDMTTSVYEAKRFAEESGIDWVAVAVGQVHRLRGSKSRINFERLKELEEALNIPMVIHGGSGIDETDLKKLVSGKVSKMNYGTGLRVAFGESLKKSVEDNPEEFDRLILFENSQLAVKETAKEIINNLKAKEKLYYENN